MTPRVRITQAALLAATLALGGGGLSAAAQAVPPATATPESAAALFLRSVRAIRWDATAQLLDAATLERFHQVVTLMADNDSTGGTRSYLTGTDAVGYAALSPGQVFGRAMGAMIDDMPGLMHALYDRDDEVLGHVDETDGTAHVVYRTTARLSGAVSEVKVMQLVRTDAGWRVHWSHELETLDAALRGVPRTRTPPPGMPS